MRPLISLFIPNSLLSNSLYSVCDIIFTSFFYRMYSPLASCFLIHTNILGSCTDCVKQCMFPFYYECKADDFLWQQIACITYLCSSSVSCNSCAQLVLYLLIYFTFCLRQAIASPIWIFSSRRLLFAFQLNPTITSYLIVRPFVNPVVIFNPNTYRFLNLTSSFVSLTGSTPQGYTGALIDPVVRHS